MSYVKAKVKNFIYTLNQFDVAPKLLTIESSSLFHRNLYIFEIILVYEWLNNNLFYMEKIALQKHSQSKIASLT